MATYIIGDVHGCYDELIALLKQISFVPGTDVLWFTGDLLAKGPKSLEVLRYVRSLGKSAKIVLGNHDLNLLAVYKEIKLSKFRDDSITRLLEASDSDKLFNWLRSQPLLQIDEKKN